MKLVFEIALIWTVLNFVVGIPLWMLVKLRDRREREAETLNQRTSRAGESNLSLSGLDLPRGVAAGRVLPYGGPAGTTTVNRADLNNRSTPDI